jgi:hypothetical protein
MIPNILHYVQLSNGGRSWKLHHYLSVKSAKLRSGFDKIYMWVDEDPMGEWWDLTKPMVEIVKIEPPSKIFDKEITQLAHKSDVLRLQILIENGGVYVDTDTIFAKSFTSLLNNRFVMGHQGLNGNEGLCPAVLLSEKDSYFAKQWLMGFNDYFFGGPPGSDTWCTHSVYYPMQLAKLIPDSITILNHESFFWPLYHQSHMDQMFEQIHEFPNAFSHHLWESAGKKYLENLTVESILNTDTTFSRLVKDLL